MQDTARYTALAAGFPELLRRALAATADTFGSSADHAKASVLVPVVLAEAPFVLLTRRSASLRRHPDQVSFPGGRIDESDGDPETAALREAQEEIGLDPAACSIVGRLPSVLTTTGFEITPVVACVRADALWQAAPAEVAEILVLPVANLFDPGAVRRERALLRGTWHEYWVWHHPDHLIWGATAAILSTLAARLHGAVQSTPWRNAPRK